MTAPNQPIDPLTGAIKKEAFEPDLQAALAGAEAADQPLSMVSLDIDHFLRINEDHGREIGDLVLKTLAELLISGLPDNISVYRYGGDEFYLIIPNTSRESALLTMEGIRQKFAQPRSYGASELDVQISIGIASYPIDATDPTELQRKADQALYRAKKSGRSQVLLAYDEKMIPKTVHFTETQLERLSALAEELDIKEASLLREALDDLISKYTVTRLGFS